MDEALVSLHEHRICNIDFLKPLIYRNFAIEIGDHKSDFKAYSPLSSSYRVLSFDFRGHGQSSQTEPFTFHQLVEDIESIRQHFSGPDRPCIVCGGSFGGFLAQQYAITYPDQVSHLILRGTAPSHHRKCPMSSVLFEAT